jgi:hypothetical protein
MEKLKKFTQAYVRFVQKILLFILLFLLYFLGFGLTKIFITIFRLKLFDKKSHLSKSFWQKTESDLDKNSFFIQV